MAVLARGAAVPAMVAIVRGCLIRGFGLRSYGNLCARLCSHCPMGGN
jgi:hypothetical protein